MTSFPLSAGCVVKYVGRGRTTRFSSGLWGELLSCFRRSSTPGGSQWGVQHHPSFLAGSKAAPPSFPAGTFPKGGACPGGSPGRSKHPHRLVKFCWHPGGQVPVCSLGLQHLNKCLCICSFKKLLFIKSTTLLWVKPQFGYLNSKPVGRLRG